jgi:hypothetical protein
MCLWQPPQAELVSEHGNVSVPVGGSARLTCLLTNLDPRQVIWRRGFEVSPSRGAVAGSARLTCLLTNLDPRQVIWRRGFEVSPSGGAASR